MHNIVAVFRKRYRRALLAIALLVTTLTVLVESFLLLQHYDAKVINVAGRQRMLSQKIALHSNTLIAAANLANTSEQKQLLQQAITEFVDGHQFLLTKQNEHNYKYLNHALEQHYFSNPTVLDEQVKAYVAQAKRVLTSLSERSDSSELFFKTQQVQHILQLLDHAVLLYEQQAVKKVDYLKWLQLVLWLLVIVLLLIEFWFVFKPMEQQIHIALDNYKQQKLKAEQIALKKERFVARASHEFRTPLQGLMASIEALDITSSQQELRLQAQYCANRLLTMLDELQDLQQLSAGQWQLKPTNNNLGLTIEQAMAPFKFLAQQQQIDLSIQLAPQLNREVYIDHQRLQQIITQLCSNAIKFTPEGGCVNVAANWSEKQALLLQVTDTGCGFTLPLPSLEEREHDQETNFQGLQTGIKRVLHLLRAMSGEIKFSNIEPHGAKVSVSLPVATVQSNRALDNTSTQQYRVSLQHALIVEDNKLNAMILGRILTNLAISYDIAENGLLATQCAAEKQYDVIFMDLNMPVMDGFHAIEIIRSELQQEVPILVVTANTAQEDTDRAYALGANGHIYKPISAESVEHALIELTSQSSATD